MEKNHFSMTINAHHSQIKGVFPFLALSSNSTMANKISLLLGGCLTHDSLIVNLSPDACDEYPNKYNDFSEHY